MIKLAVSSYSLRHLPYDEMLETSVASGYRRLELVTFGSHFPPEQPERSAAQLRDDLSRHNLELIGLYPRPIDTKSDAALVETTGGVKRTIDLAAELGCGRIVFSPLVPREGFRYDRLIDACRGLADHIGDRDVVVCLENHHGWPLSYAEDYDRVFSQLDDPRIGITVDTGHFGASGVDLPAFVRRFARHVRHVHLKDQLGTESVAFGRGQTDNKGTIDALRTIGFDGYATVELEVRDAENSARYVADAHRYCVEVLGLSDE